MHSFSKNFAGFGALALQGDQQNRVKVWKAIIMINRNFPIMEKLNF
jgi:hypothetical protein